MEAYIGIDVAVAKDKYLPVAICYKQDGRLIPLPLSTYKYKPPKGLGNPSTLDEKLNQLYAQRTKAYIQAICETYDLTPVRIGIDSPLKPRRSHLSRRLAEQHLDKAGISCYATPSSDEFRLIKAKAKAHIDAGSGPQNMPHSMQLFMLAGFAMAEELSSLAPCIEVYPQATVRLLNAASKHKSHKDQALKQLQVISQHTGWPASSDDWEAVVTICHGPMHDKVDAYGAAWVASLSSRACTYFGDPQQDDAICVPRLQVPAFQDIPPMSSTPRTQNSYPYQSKDAQHQRICPACETYVFKRWPWGWDAHAAFKCEGISAGTPEKRKAEFRTRHLR